MHDYGVVPQSIPPLLTHSGARSRRGSSGPWRRASAPSTLRFKCRRTRHPGSRPTDNERVVALARDLAAGETLVLFQPRLHVALGGWDIRGDVDVLRLERDPPARSTS